MHNYVTYIEELAIEQLYGYKREELYYLLNSSCAIYLAYWHIEVEQQGANRVFYRQICVKYYGKTAI